MIFVCEPNCQGISHESFNLGTLYGLSLAYPEEEILFYARKSHQKNLLRLQEKYHIKFPNISFYTIRGYLGNDRVHCLWYFALLYYLVRKARKKNARAFYLLATTQFQQRALKDLAAKPENKSIIFAMNMHGEFDRLAYPHFEVTQFPFLRTDQKGFLEKICAHRKDLLRLVFSHIQKGIINSWEKILQVVFPAPKYDLRETMCRKNGANVRYVALSDHIVKTLPKYISTEGIHICALPLPAIYEPLKEPIKNKMLRVAVFGYGHSAMLYWLNVALQGESIKEEYEIRVIGMDGRGTEDFPRVTWPIRRVLNREEMEQLAEDIDMFLILYEKERYVLSCSGSIIEAHRYGKPILYLENPCIDAFNDKNHPIGIRCTDVKDMAKKMKRIIEEYPAFEKELAAFRQNIIKQREKLDIRNNLDRIRKIIDVAN